MDATSTFVERRMRAHAGYALVEGALDLALAGWRALARLAQAIGEAQRRAAARRDLHALSDHFLRDIGRERSQIDRLFRCAARGLAPAAARAAARPR